MTKESAINILQLLIDGIDPITGEILSDDHLCNHPQVIRALHTAVLSLSVDKTRPAAAPSEEKPKASRPWTDEDLIKLEKLYLSGMRLEDICSRLQRRERGIRKQLQYLGLIESQEQPSSCKLPGLERAGLPWTRNEDLQLKRLFDEKQNIEDIAAQLHRSTYSIFCRMEKLGCYGDEPGYPQREKMPPSGL